MQIFVDADACPVVGIVEKVAKEHSIPVTLLCDTNHVLSSDYSEVIVVGAGADAVDYKLISICHKGDIVVSQDYGVAAMALGKNAYAIHQSGKWYTNENIDQMLMERHLTEKKDALNTVVLYIPEKAQLSEAELQLSDGDLAADQLLCKEMTLELLSGDLMLDKGEFEKFDAKLSDGDLNVKELQCTDNMQLKSGNGDVTIKKAELADGQIALSDGDIQIDNSSFNGDMKINSSCGDVSVH